MSFASFLLEALFNFLRILILSASLKRGDRFQTQYLNLLLDHRQALDNCRTHGACCCFGLQPTKEKPSVASFFNFQSATP